MVINEENLPKLERQMSPELKRSRSVTCLEIEIECCTSQHKTVKFLLMKWKV